jgi:tRNA (adenine37-N6)-methyltransferase
MKFCYQTIGYLETPFAEAEGAPIQPSGAVGVKGRLRLLPEYAAGLADLEGFSHIIVLYHLHLAEGFNLTVTPFLDKATRGLFATRAPKRPNPIGLSVLRLTGIEGNILFLENVDMLDASPVIDLKPYVPAFDSCPDATAGWLEGRAAKAENTRADRRFEGAGSDEA